jgi:DNA-directed RNA polymerase specialized sigma24 family protein
VATGLRELTLARARARDEHAFRELTEPHRRELQLHCYRSATNRFGLSA